MSEADREWNVSIEQLLMMSTELLANWEWLPGEPLSGLECLKAQLDFRYKISAFFIAFYSEYWLSKNKAENEWTEMNSVVNIKSYKSHSFQEWVMIHHVWTISYNILAFMGHSWLSYALKWTGIDHHAWYSSLRCTPGQHKSLCCCLWKVQRSFTSSTPLLSSALTNSNDPFVLCCMNINRVQGWI